MNVYYTFCYLFTLSKAKGNPQTLSSLALSNKLKLCPILLLYFDRISMLKAVKVPQHKTILNTVFAVRPVASTGFFFVMSLIVWYRYFSPPGFSSASMNPCSKSVCLNGISATKKYHCCHITVNIVTKPLCTAKCVLLRSFIV